jgi:hypothetical protein
MYLITWYLGYLQTEGNVMDTQLEITLKIKHLKIHEYTVSDILFHRATRQCKFCKSSERTTTTLSEIIFVETKSVFWEN